MALYSKREERKMVLCSFDPFCERDPRSNFLYIN
jgi:hypothetical protein